MNPSWFETYLARRNATPTRLMAWWRWQCRQRRDSNVPEVAMRQNDGASAKYKKLDDGTWGVWLDAVEGRPGQTVGVTTAGGEVKSEKLARLIWSKPGLQLWSLRRDELPQAAIPCVVEDDDGEVPF